jgi:hypothetical protein|tara:strand:- start:1056 stop:1355 length:300 start_codon:yes stop_codon:yes gene_type:complete
MAKKNNKSRRRTNTGKKRKTVRFSKTNRIYPFKRVGRTRRRGRKMTGGGIQNTLLPSPVMNGWYDMMSTPMSMLMSYDGVEYPNSAYANPLKGHNINKL